MNKEECCLSGGRGFTLIEVLVALGIFGMVGVAFMLALQGGWNAARISDEQLTAENLARVQLEYIRSEPYFDPGLYGGVPYAIPPGSDPGLTAGSGADTIRACVASLSSPASC